MTAFGCDEFREIAPDLALGLLGGDERGAAITHLAGCARCQAHLEGLVRVADDLLLLAPQVEPEIGFESRVMARLAAGGAFRTSADTTLGASAAAPAAVDSDAGRFSAGRKPATHGAFRAAPAAIGARWGRPVISWPSWLPPRP